MAQQLTKENTRTIVKCGKCGAMDVDVRAWVSPNLNNAFSIYCSGKSLEDTETCYCRTRRPAALRTATSRSLSRF